MEHQRKDGDSAPDEEMDQMLDCAGRMQHYRGEDVKKGERSEESAASVYDQYPAAGSFQGAEFFYIRRPCGWLSSFTKELILKGQGTVGLITYLRTDSTRVSRMKLTAAAQCPILSETLRRRIYAASWCRLRKRRTGKIQDAHEAIRPTDIRRLPVQSERISVTEISSVSTS